MFEVRRSARDRIDLELRGRLDDEETRALLGRLLGEAEGIEHGRLFYRVRDFDLPTFGAIWQELKRMPELTRLIGKFDRAAIVADAGWLRKLSELEGLFLPGLEIEAFDLSREAEAEAWLRGGSGERVASNSKEVRHA